MSVYCGIYISTHLVVIPDLIFSELAKLPLPKMGEAYLYLVKIAIVNFSVAFHYLFERAYVLYILRLPNFQEWIVLDGYMECLCNSPRLLLMGIRGKHLTNCT
jgi:hypothetical protein